MLHYSFKDLQSLKKNDISTGTSHFSKKKKKKKQDYTNAYIE